MGAKVSRTDFAWVGTDEPHATRRKLMLAKYPEIKSLMGVDARFKWIVTALVLTQIATFYVCSTRGSFWIYFLVAYFFTGVINHALMLGMSKERDHF